MNEVSICLLLVAALLGFLALGLWVPMALLAMGWLGMVLFVDAPVGQIVATSMWGASASWTLSALPLFIWMGVILFKTRLSEQMFTGLAPWFRNVPGGLIHVNIFGCAIFAAVSGSSAATAATIGKMALPEMSRRNYHNSAVIGSLAASGTLGILIPPSIMMIVYGVTAEVSITKLFVAGIVPGLVLISMFSGFVILWALLNPSKQPPKEPAVQFVDRLRASVQLMPVLGLLAGIMCSIYLGIATATEAAAFGVVGALLLSASTGSLTLKSFVDSLLEAVATNAMIGFILASAAFVSATLAFLGIPMALSEWIGGLDLNKFQLLLSILVLYVLLGCFIDGVSIVVLTSAILIPMVQQAGVDLIWFGIFVVLTVEMSLITPPVGLNLFVLQGMSKRPLMAVARASFPFFIVLVLVVFAIILMPDIVTFLPNRM